MALVRFALLVLLPGAMVGEEAPVGPGGDVAGAPLMRRQSTDALERTERIVSVDAHAHLQQADDFDTVACQADGATFQVKTVECNLDNMDCNCCPLQTDTMKQVVGETCEWVKILPQEADPGPRGMDHTAFAQHGSPNDAFEECKCAAAQSARVKALSTQGFGPASNDPDFPDLEITGHPMPLDSSPPKEICSGSDSPPGSVFCDFAPSGCFIYKQKAYFNSIYTRAASDGVMKFFNKTLPKNPTFANPYAHAVCILRTSSSLGI